MISWATIEMSHLAMIPELASTEDITDGTRVNISHISNHPNYRRHCKSDTLDKGVPDFDYSILHLATPVAFNEKAIPACLPNKSMDDQFLDGKHLTVSGWGLPWPGVLHKARYPAHTNEECKKYNMENGCDMITENMLCAGNPHTRTASHSGGDSGGRLKNWGVYIMNYPFLYKNQTEHHGLCMILIKRSFNVQ